jgi:hypothetical protein
MAVRRKRAFCRSLLLAASAFAIFNGPARAQSPADDMADLNTRILENPQDSELNIEYARLAERHGKLRLALAAYERVLINEPDNVEAQRGFARIRRIVEPPFQSRRIELGGRWDSNPWNEPDPEDGAWSAFVRATMVDERRVGGRRWRSIASIDGEVVPDSPQLDYGYVGAQTGPIIDAAPNVAVIPAVGVGISTLDDTNYFNEAHIGITVEGQRSGVSFWGRARGTYRDYSEQSTADQGGQVEISGAATAPQVVSSRDSVTFGGWARWSGVKGSSINNRDEEVAPGRYAEVGAEATYHYRLNDNLSLSAGLVAYQRNYQRTEVAGENREDTSITPQATLLVWNVLPCSCAVRINYRHRDNSSNDPLSDFEADEASVSLFAQF